MKEADLKKEDFLIVWHCIHRYALEATEDNYQTGCIGFIKAIRAFDASKNYAFATFAYRCILNEILSNQRKKQIQTFYIEQEELIKTQDNLGLNTPVELLESLKKSIHQLKCNERQKEILFNYFYELAFGNPITQEQLSKQLGCTVGVTYGLIRKTREKIAHYYPV